MPYKKIAKCMDTILCSILHLFHMSEMKYIGHQNVFGYRLLYELFVPVGEYTFDGVCVRMCKPEH